MKAFEQLFKEHFEALCGFAFKYVKDLDDSKNIVHEVFVQLWEKFEGLNPETNYKSYLYTSVRNRCLNAIRNNKKHMQLDFAEEKATAQSQDSLEVKELEAEIEFAINSLPEKCRQVFEKSRIEGLKYSEIAEKMNISIKTVEAQMSKALKILRAHLAEFLSLIIFTFIR